MTKNNLRILLIGILLSVAIIATIIHNPKSPGSSESGTSDIKLPHYFSLMALNVENEWGYEIYIDSTLFISQETIPGVAGAKKFESQNDALLCGELVIQKLKENKRPTITNAELDSLGIVF